MKTRPSRPPQHVLSARKEFFRRCDEILADRESERGDFETSLTLIADYWNSFLTNGGFLTTKQLNPSDVGMMMTLMKIARMSTSYDKDDNFLDACNFMVQAYISRTRLSSINFFAQLHEQRRAKQREDEKSDRLLAAIVNHFGINPNEPLDIQHLLQRIQKSLKVQDVEKSEKVEEVS